MPIPQFFYCKYMNIFVTGWRARNSLFSAGETTGYMPVIKILGGGC